MFRTRSAPLGLLLLIASIALAGCQARAATAPGEPPPNTVSARGTGTAAAAPDQAEMSFGLTIQRDDAKKALEDASRVARTIADAVKKAGVPAEDVQTQNVSVYPQYSGGDKDTPPKIAGYSATISVRVKIRDIERVGTVIAAATDAGATEISGPTFTLSEDAPAAAEAIDEAIADARRRAEAMAKAAGKTLGDVLSISEVGITAPPLYAGDGRLASADVPIEPGQLDVSAQVVVVFELK